MNFNDYQQEAMRTRGVFTSQQDTLTNAALGIAGEAGEVAGSLKKYLHQGHPLDISKLMDEAGDVLWYLAELAEALDVSLGEIAQMNIDKLKERYPDGFSVERSINRKGDNNG